MYKPHLINLERGPTESEFWNPCSSAECRKILDAGSLWLAQLARMTWIHSRFSYRGFSQEHDQRGCKTVGEQRSSPSLLWTAHSLWCSPCLPVHLRRVSPPQSEGWDCLPLVSTAEFQPQSHASKTHWKAFLFQNHQQRLSNEEESPSHQSLCELSASIERYPCTECWKTSQMSFPESSSP